MSREEINISCEKFKARLGERASKNVSEQQFFPPGTTQEIFRNHKLDLKQLLRDVSRALQADAEKLVTVVQRILDYLSNVLATVLTDRERDDTSVLNRFLRLILHENNDLRDTLVLTDSELPISRENAEYLFGDGGPAFHTTQLRFCAIVLQEEDEVRYVDAENRKCPLPYLKQREIGHGAFGVVYEVKIERHHMRSMNGNSENRKPMVLARKDFGINREQAFQEELNVLRRIMRQPQRHNHVVTVLGILQHGTTCSLFFPLATCDLSDYFKRSDPPVSQTLDEKRALYHRGVSLAGALAFLHHGLSSMSCYHLDLKPQNVLVYNAGKTDEEWKITDFGLSRVRVKANTPRDGPSTMATGVEGTHLAPECAVLGGKVSALSDVWSFGCIFSLVLIYMVKGCDGIREFSKQRQEQSEGDFFYVNAQKPKISPVVTDWFDHLKDLTSKDPHPKVMSESLDFLRKNVLCPDRKNRMEARLVETRLMGIWEDYTHLELPTPVGKKKLGFIFPGKKPKLKVPSGLSANPPEPTSSARESRFSPKGDLLVCFSTTQNQIWQVSRTLASMRNSHDMPEPPSVVRIPGSANSVAVSSEYICNGLDGNCFECYIYPATSGSLTTNPETLIFLPHLGSIKMAALSPNGELAAFVVAQEPGGTDRECLRYFCKTNDLINRNDGHPSPPSSRSNSAISTPSIGSMTTRSATTKVGPAVGSAADIRFFDFTGNGQFLIMVAQEGITSFRVQVWETYHGALYQSMLIPHMGLIATTATHFTACVAFVLNGAPTVVILSQELYLIHADLSRKSRKSIELDDRMIHMHYSEEYKLLTFLARDRRRVYALPISALASAQTVRPTSIAKTNPSKLKGLLSMTVRGNQGERGELLIATTEGKIFSFDVSVPD